MNTLEHKYFGKLNFDNANEIGIVWKGEVDGIDVTMWYDEDVEVMKGELDRFALFLENIKDNIKKATEALIETLKEDREYMDFHLEECKDANLPDDVVKFVSQMTVTAIDLWIGDSEYRITMDFMILPDESDQILCVTFNERGEISTVDWES
jgi:hypothetical protein